MKIPYYIWAPPWTYRSSGTRVLHLLCHELRKARYKAWLVSPSMADAQRYALNPNLDCGLLDQYTENYYKDAGVGAVAVYPDIVKDNPFNSARVVRYLLAPAGAYGGSLVAEFGAEDKVYGYRSDIAARDGVLCLPTFDPEVFYPPAGGSARSGACYYAHKYDKIHGNVLLGVTDGAVRLEGTWEKIAGVLRSAAVCYVYEVSEIIVLAQMCGCPVEFVQTPYFDGVDLEGWDFALGGESGRDAVKRWDARFKEQFKKFLRETQGMVGEAGAAPAVSSSQN